MATAPAVPFVSVEEYLSSSWQPDMEYVDGVLVERSVGTIPHSLLQEILLFHFRQFRRLNLHALPECRTKVNDTRFRIPDIILVEKPFDRKARFYADVPLTVIEILSPDDKMKESLHRFGDYARMGVPHIIQMDPDDRTTRVYRSGDLIATELTSLTLPGRSIEFNSRELLAGLDEA